MDDENHCNQVLTNVFVELWWFHQHRYLYAHIHHCGIMTDRHISLEGKQTSMFLPGKKKNKLQSHELTSRAPFMESCCTLTYTRNINRPEKHHQSTHDYHVIKLHQHFWNTIFSEEWLSAYLSELLIKARQILLMSERWFKIQVNATARDHNH